jgi:hypothetical protein
MIIYTNGNRPLKRNITLKERYHGWGGIRLGTIFIVPGFFIAFFFSPIKDPINTKGAEQHIHKTSKENRVVNGTAPDEPSIERNMFIIKKIVKAIEGYSRAVYKAFVSHSFP